jgi:hypothetical protein
MKALALILCLLAGNLGAALASGTKALYYFENNGNDESSNGYTLTTVGTVPYTTTAPTPPQGTYSVGTFSDANYFTAPAGLRTALSGAQYYSIEFYWSKTANVGSEIVMCGQDGTTFWFDWFNDGKIYFVRIGTTNLVSGILSPLSQFYHVAVTNDGTNGKLYINGSVVATGASYTLPTLTSLFIGRYFTGGASADVSKVDKMRFSTYASAGDVPTVFPIADPSVSVLSPYASQSNRPFVSPLWWLK